MFAILAFTRTAVRARCQTSGHKEVHFIIPVLQNVTLKPHTLSDSTHSIIPSASSYGAAAIVPVSPSLYHVSTHLSIMASKLEAPPLLSKLHRNIRLGNWKSVLATLTQHNDEIQNNEFAPNPFSIQSIVPLLIKENTIGWTAVHFTALHGAPDLFLWKWALFRVLEEHELYYKMMKHGDNAGLYYDYLANPFFRRTDAGHSATDLFFSKRLHVSF